MAYIELAFPSGIAEYYPAINTYLAIGELGASPETYTVIANLQDWSLDMTCDKVDTTSHSNTNPWSRQGPTLLNAGTSKTKLLFIPDSSGPGSHGFAGGLLAIFSARQLRNYLIQFPDPSLTQWLFSGYIGGFPLSMPTKGALEAAVDFLWTDMPTFE
jgi:hypothetical protein